MRTIQFCAFGNTYCVDVPETEFGLGYQNGSAMDTANREFLWKLDDYHKNIDGKWQKVHDDCFQWVELSPDYWEAWD